jgi:3-oxoacyl-[acyl-carrier-protein] synthase III
MTPTDRDAAERVIVAGVGLAVPERIRGNDDPIFDWLRAHPPAHDPFQGYVSRRVLGEDQDLADIMVPAARAAMSDAGTSSEDIDMLVGFGSVSTDYMPNPLVLVHQKTGLLSGVPIIPLANDYANFTAGISVASALVESGQARNVLVVTGCNWTRHMDYHTPQAVCAGDGAGAAVVGRRRAPERFAFTDSFTITESALFGAMYMAGDPSIGTPLPDGPHIPGYDHRSFGWPYFHITTRGLDAFTEFGQRRPPEAAKALLARHRIDARDVTLIPHQTSTVLLDYWYGQIGAGCSLDTLTTYGNVPHANIALTLASRYAEITTRYLLFLTLGVEFSTTATLLTRT